MIYKLNKYSLIVLLFFSVLVSAQPRLDRLMKLPDEIIPSAQYKNSELLVSKAILQLKSGDVNESEKTISASIDLYPTMKVFDYVDQVALLSDISKANVIMNALYAKVASLNDPIEMLDVSPIKVVDGKMVKVIRNHDKNSALFNFAYKICLINKDHGNRKLYLKSLERAISITIIKKSDYDLNYETKFRLLLNVAYIEKDFEKAILLISEKPVGKFENIETKSIRLVQLYIEKNDFDKAINIVEENLTQKKYLRSIKNYLLFQINALKGNNEAALLNLKKSLYEKEEDYIQIIYYYLGIVDLNKKNYHSAIKNLNLSITKKEESGLASDEDLSADKYKVYKLMGDAYKGLKQYDKAKDFYELSLLINPDYQLAISAMTNLESLVASTISTDKTPPTIKITEPAVNRGLEIVSAGNDILVKGIAADPSGLKSVTINGISVYAQKDGNFWGNIPLNKDVNKITVIATDEAGNTAEHLFEITKTEKETPSDIIAVTEKEGKSYCLLIGAQNYEDSSIPSLDNPIQDAVRLKLILKNDYGFNDSNVITLFNPTANDVKRQLLELSTTIQPEDNLLIFYAGHGIWVEKEKKGYWLLTDAKRNDPNTWLQNKEVLNLIAKLPSRSTLLITDACFSGGVFKTRSIRKDAPEVIKSMNEKISRVAITSGNDTEVPDESIFMRYLVKALKENKEKYVTAQKMFINQIMEAVMKETKTEPRYGTLELAGHVGGDYVFVKE